MPIYDDFAPWYERFTGDRESDLCHVHTLINQHSAVKSVLDLACGTGIFLRSLPVVPRRVGIDISPAMLSEARLRDTSEYIEGDMRSVHLLNEYFDIVVCLFDSINYILTESGWLQVFQTAKAHMNDRSLFVCDMTTPYKLNSLTQKGTIQFPVEAYTASILVKKYGERFDWNIRLTDSKKN